MTFLKSGPGTDPTGAVGRGGGGVRGGLGVQGHSGSLSDGFLSRGARPRLVLAIETLLSDCITLGSGQGSARSAFLEYIPFFDYYAITVVRVTSELLWELQTGCIRSQRDPDHYGNTGVSLS